MKRIPDNRMARLFYARRIPSWNSLEFLAALYRSDFRLTLHNYRHLFPRGSEGNVFGQFFHEANSITIIAPSTGLFMLLSAVPPSNLEEFSYSLWDVRQVINEEAAP